MNKRNMTLGMAVSFSVLMAGCASTPDDNQKVDEARAAYEEIKDDPNVARSGDRHLRSAQQELSRAESLLEEDAEIIKIEHAAYLANRHAQIAAEQGKRAALQEQINSAEERRRELEMQMSSNKAAQARREAEELRLQMEAMQAEQTDRGMVLTLGDVLFDLNQAELKASGEATVQRLAEFMREYEERRVRVEGYTDSTGEASYNQELSERRAEAVRDALLNMGISRDRVETKGFGEEYPVASNDSSGGRQQNRRVEIVISDEDGDIETR
ncbi:MULTISPECIES: OmpA family protein [Marinobacter]|uniref:OmpA family protein n=1 Tax=Marinobacter TaxID=2742 RepID=UPI001244966B|nr:MULTISPECIES: OmpA family protein [Marinobacter]MBL3557389.1 OmpA family protein [Marinobacter sp. JB05H06]